MAEAVPRLLAVRRDHGVMTSTPDRTLNQAQDDGIIIGDQNFHGEEGMVQ